MNKELLIKFKENEKLFDHFKEHSYYIKYLNRTPDYFNEFSRKMKEVYKISNPF